MKNFMMVCKKNKGFILPITLIVMGIISAVLINVLNNVKGMNDYFASVNNYALQQKDIDRKVQYIMTLFNEDVVSDYEHIKSKGIKSYYTSKKNIKLVEYEDCYIIYKGYDSFYIMDNKARNKGVRREFYINIDGLTPKFDFIFVEK